MGDFAATSNTGELRTTYHALDWIDSRRTSPPSVVRLRCNIVPYSDYSVKLFAARSTIPVANKRTIAGIDALLVKGKNNDMPFSWTPAHRNADSPF